MNEDWDVDREVLDQGECNIDAGKGLVVRGHGALGEVVVQQNTTVDMAVVATDQPDRGPRRLYPHKLGPLW